MKRLPLITFVFLATLFSCSSDNEDNTSENLTTETTLKMDIEISGNTFEIDKPISYTVNTNENIIEISTSIDNWKNSSGVLYPIGNNYGKSRKVIQSVHEIGQKTIYIMVRNEKEEIVKKSFQVEITKGTSVKIKSIKIISFKNINSSWDPEYPNDNINRLADLKFSLRKNFIITSFDGALSSSTQNWYISELLENQGNLTWDLNNKNLYIDPNSNFTFSLGDIDENYHAQNLLDNDYDYVTFNLKNYTKDKPNIVTLKNGGLEFEVELEW